MNPDDVKRASERQAVMQEVFRRMGAIEQEYAELLMRLGCKRITMYRF